MATLSMTGQNWSRSRVNALWFPHTMQHYAAVSENEVAFSVLLGADARCGAAWRVALLQE